MSVRALKALTTIAATTLVLTLAGSAPAKQAQTEPIRKDPVIRVVAADTKVSKEQRAQLHQAAVQIGTLRKIAWACQDDLIQTGLLRHRTEAAVSIWALPQSIAYRTKFVARKWIAIAKGCQTTRNTHVIGSTWDWPTAVRIVQRIYPGTADWLLYISHREGGWGRFVMNTQGSGAGGWLQFMASTYYAYNNAAYADVRRRGFIIDERTNRWDHPLGQAITAGYMRYTGLDGCHWCL